MEQEPKIVNKEVIERLQRELQDLREYLERVGKETLEHAKLEEVALSEEKVKKALENIHKAMMSVAIVVDDLVNFP